MNAAHEFRVLTGSQAGCRIAIRPGIYRVGASERCDLLIEGASSDAPAFVLLVGERQFGLEALVGDLLLGGRTPDGIVSLVAGQIFSRGDVHFSVDAVDAPWPSEDEIAAAELPADTEAEAGPDSAPAGDGENVPCIAETAPEPRSHTHDAAISPAAPTSFALRAAPSAVRRRRPFWMVWLGATTAFLVVGISILVTTLRPSDAAVAPSSDHGRVALERIVSNAKADARLELSRRSDVWRVTGHITTRARQLELIRAVRAADRQVQVQLSVDEDVEALAKETLTRFRDLDVAVKRVHLGEVTLTGHVRRAAQRDGLCRALFDDIPGLTKVHSEVSADDDAAVTLNEMLAAAGLATYLKGRMEDSRVAVDGTVPERRRKEWNEVRSQMEKRFGASLTITERFGESGVAGRAVVAVGGTVPYVLLNTGEIEGRGPAGDLP